MTTNPRTPLPRRLNLGDIAIIVGAVAIYLTLVRQSRANPVSKEVWTSNPFFSVVSFGSGMDIRYELAALGWTVATFALITMRLRRPRPRWHRLMRQPGFLACVAASIATIASFTVDRVGDLLLFLLSTDPLGPSEIVEMIGKFRVFTASTAMAGSLAVLVSWTILRLSGRWITEQSWIDRTGCLIGVGWFLIPVGNLYLTLTCNN